jgi:tetratricopeptide (TPR) repeat protein
MTGPHQTEWLDRLEADHDNLRSALDWSAEEPREISAGLRLAGALHRFWFSRAHFAEGRRRYADLLRLDAQALPTPERALCLQGAGNMAYRQGQYAEAEELFGQSLGIWRQVGNRWREAELVANLGNVAYFQADYERAGRHFNQTLEIHSEVPSPTAALLALHGLGSIAFRSGDFPGARARLEQCVAESRGCGNRPMEGSSKISLGLLDDEEGARELAHIRFTESLAIFREIGDVSQEMICLTNLGMVNRGMGKYELSARYYRDGLLLAVEQPGNRDERVVAYMVEGVARLALVAGEAHRAAWLLAAGDGLRRSIGIPRPPIDTADFDQAIAELRAALDTESFDAAWAEGLGSKADAAISIALQVVSAGD